MPSLGKDFLLFTTRHEVLIGIFIQFVSSIFLAHGYDFRVSYVAGRNVAGGLSPYVGGFLEGVLSQGYGGYVQGIGETPLWPLYLGLVYLLSGGGVILFNVLMKIPIILANIVFSYILYSRGNHGWRFFLFNPFVILTSAAWGKPDNIATLLIILGLISIETPTRSAVVLSLATNLKPLTAAVMPSILSTLRYRQLNARVVFPATAVLSVVLFAASFMVFGWSLDTVVNGFGNWFIPAGGLSPFNVVELIYGVQRLPGDIIVVGYVPVAAVLILAVVFLLKPPADMRELILYSLVSAAVFFSTRPWVSEQNILLILGLTILYTGREPPPPLWVIPLIFMFLNNSIQQQLYLIRPTIIEELHIIDSIVKPHRLLIRFITSIIWYAVLWSLIYRLVRGGVKE